MSAKEIIQSKYHTALAILNKAFKKNPATMWGETLFGNPIWHIAFHVLFYTYLSLQPTLADHIRGRSNRKT